ncbi:uncharacterized protein LOC127814141 [Diospyros lotus]|uniref:uncharacterized protein LOC127814141 n=1 Tax=Diospyros lotus TaxID=55363 RepID=UPI00225A664A|nr:uncharacterized protein LOC127814141 [Diospyros lotus]
MSLELLPHGGRHHHHHPIPSSVHSPTYLTANIQAMRMAEPKKEINSFKKPKPQLRWGRKRPPQAITWPSYRAISASLAPLDLTEDNVKQVLTDARAEFGQIFDASVGITGVAELAEMDGPFVKIRLKGRFWHKRSTVLDRLANYLKQKIPEILEVDIEDEKQLDDSPENF